MDNLEKYIILPVTIFLAWLGSFEWRLRGKISKDSHTQYKAEIDKRLDRGTARFDRIEERLIEQGQTLVEVHTIVKALAKKNGIK